MSPSVPGAQSVVPGAQGVIPGAQGVVRPGRGGASGSGKSQGRDDGGQKQPYSLHGASSGPGWDTIRVPSVNLFRLD